MSSTVQNIITESREEYITTHNSAVSLSLRYLTISESNSHFIRHNTNTIQTHSDITNQFQRLSYTVKLHVNNAKQAIYLGNKMSNALD